MQKTILFILSIFIITFYNIPIVALAEEASSYTYEGETTEKGIYQGQGNLYYKDKLFYEGGFSNNLFEGEGVLYQVSTEGRTTVNTEPTGSSAITNEIKYKGKFKNGYYHGQGTLYYDLAIPSKENVGFDGTNYKGKFSYGQYNGYGTEFAMDGSVNQQGYFINGVLYKYEGPKDNKGKMHGNGRLIDKEGKIIFEGTFVHGEIHGIGKLKNDEHTWKYVGPFVHDMMQGKGKVYMNDELYYEGEFYQNVKEGTGTLFFPKKKVAYQGEFKNDRANIQPFQIKSELQLEKDMSGTYSVYVVLLNEFKTEDTLNYFKKLKKDAKIKFDSIKVDNSNDSYISFKATKAVEDLTKNFTDDFIGFNFVSNKTKLMIYTQYEIYGYLATTLDSSLMNVNYELILPNGAKNVNADQKANKLKVDKQYAWVDITDTDYKFVQLQIVNIGNILISGAFFIVLLAGIIYFRKKKRQKKIAKKEAETKKVV
ncbi:hypothetical protein [Viridibacillus arvi]|uniref:hypothetical protein n=1 Tax=Viridibacillus arvi TaxID=263475 RepID=UPI0034CDE759